MAIINPVDKALEDLVIKEGWTVKREAGGAVRIVIGEESFPLTHPVAIHLRAYRKATDPETRYRHFKAAHDYFWPKTIWHYWTERRFREHCAGWNYMGWAGGSSTGKSYDAAKIALLFWFSNPTKRGVVVASTTLKSVKGRVWGYLTKLLNEMEVKLPYKYLSGNSPEILYPAQAGGKIRDTLHGIFAVAAAQGSEDEQSIKNWIGRHPDEALMIILDECTDLNPAISQSFPNLDSSEKTFQCIGIGNSTSVYDLHGALCTPKAGWPSIDPARDNKWETTQKNGICLFFSCYESPPIFEADPVRKKLLSRFLVTSEQIEEKEQLLGKGSDLFYRFVLGFWRTQSIEKTIVSKQFALSYGVINSAEWLGISPLEIVGGLDPAFSTDGDKCILRLAILGVDTRGMMVLDFRDTKLLFNITIQAKSEDAAEIQVAKQVNKILANYKCPLHQICLDANGGGRALGGSLYLESKALKPPLKILSSRSTGNSKSSTFDLTVMTPYELWYNLRKFMEQGQIRGLDQTTFAQLTSRLVMMNTLGKLSLESKLAYKKRMGAIMPQLAHSPDEADAAALCLQAAIMNFGFYPGQKRDLAVKRDFVDEKYFLYNQEREAKVIEELPLARFNSAIEDAVKSRRPF